MRDRLRSYKTTGLVMKRVNIEEADKLVTIFTRTHGKITVLAKGIRKITSRKAPHLELFSLVAISVVRGKTWDYVIEAETLEPFSELRRNLEKIAWAYKIIEQTERLCSEGIENRIIFEILLATLLRLDRVQNLNLQLLVDDYSLKLLRELGYLSREKVIRGYALERYLENVMEKNFKSNKLLARLS